MMAEREVNVRLDLNNPVFLDNLLNLQRESPIGWRCSIPWTRFAS